MKTYILDSINRFKRFSERLDVATALSNKTWVVFNDSGERELYIFQPDGSVIITSNGIGVRGQWQWIAANQSLIIHHNDTVIMLHPQYIDNTILALNLDGTRETAFLIEDKNRESFAPKSLVQLEMYFENKEQKMLLEQRQEKQRRVEEQRRIREQQRAEEEQKRIRLLKQQEAERDRQEQVERERLKRLASDKIAQLSPKWFSWAMIVFIAIGFILGCWFIMSNASDSGKGFIGCIVFGPIGGLIFGIIANSLFGKSAKEQRRQNIKKWKSEHPNNPINRYM